MAAVQLDADAGAVPAAAFGRPDSSLRGDRKYNGNRNQPGDGKAGLLSMLGLGTAAEAAPAPTLRRPKDAKEQGLLAMLGVPALNDDVVVSSRSGSSRSAALDTMAVNPAFQTARRPNPMASVHRTNPGFINPLYENTPPAADFVGTEAGLTDLGPPPSHAATKVIKAVDARQTDSSMADGKEQHCATRHRWSLVAAAALLALIAVLAATLLTGGSGGDGGAEPATNSSAAMSLGLAEGAPADIFVSTSPSVSSPTVLPTSSPSAAPTAAPTSYPSAAPTDSPTASPSSSPTTRPPIILVPGSSTVLSAGLVRLAPSGEHQLLRLTKTTLADNRTTLMGRAYGGHAWETGPTFDHPMVFTCDNNITTSIELYRTTDSASSTAPICMVRIPADGVRRRRQSPPAVRYQIDVFDLAGMEPDARSMAARFLMRATFGPTRRSIEEFLAEHRGSPEAWIEDQIATPATLLRAMHRRYSSPRISDADRPLLWTARARAACSGGARWSRFAFGFGDINTNLDVTTAGVMSIFSVLRTVVDPTTIEHVVLNPPGESRWYSSVLRGDANYARSEIDSTGEWLAERESGTNTNEPGAEWMAIDLGEVIPVTGMVTSGRRSSPGNYVSNFTVSTSTDNVTWTEVPGEFFDAGGVGAYRRATNLFPASSAVTARYVKITAMAWVGSYVAMRAAVLTDASVLSSLGAYTPFAICDVEEWIGGEITFGTNCSLSTVNPPIRFTPDHAPPADRMVASVSADTELFTLALHENSSRDGAVLLPQEGVDWSCGPGTPQAGALFASIEGTGVTLVHDRRLELVDNTLESPLVSANADGNCVSAPRSFLNAHTCVAGRESCASTRYTSATFALTAEAIVQFYRRAGLFVYVIAGLRHEEGELPPCAGSRSRWIRRQVESEDCDDQLNDATRDAISAALLDGIAHDNEVIRDIMISSDAVGCSAPIGASVLVAGNCWEHVHPFEGNVYDFTTWANLHTGNAAAERLGNPPPIKKHAWRGSAVLPFPSHHPVDRFTNAMTSSKNLIGLLGRIGDTVNFVDLPTSVQVDSMAALFGATSASGSDFGTESCGSPGEIANDPYSSNQFVFGFGASERISFQNEATDRNARDKLRGDAAPRHVAWEHAAFNATDQLRQRVAWALSQIFVVNDEPLSNSVSEQPLVYYDIFVRNAFTNYRDVMKEVSYSQAMASMLSFKDSKSLQASGYFPDENYAREIMQLFTIGLWRLHDNGTKLTNADGQHIPTYDQDDVFNFAKAWTGLTTPLKRANVEPTNSVRSTINLIDPMRLRMTVRDAFPKTDLLGGYIGDGHPLCEDLPERAFLRRGAKYEYLGTTPDPQKTSLTSTAIRTTDHRDSPWTVRLELDRNRSALYEALCSPDNTTGRCRFKSEFRLPSTVPCDGKECRIDTAVVVKLSGAGARDDGEPFDVYYEYVREPCIHLSYFDDPVLLAPRFSRGYGAVKPMCGNPRLPMAGTGCCRNTSAGLMPKGKCEHEYSDELVTLATAEARCEALGSGPAFRACAKDDGARCTCPRGADVRYGNEDVYSSYWSDIIPSPPSGGVVCNSTAFGNHTVPDGVTAICECRRPAEPYSLCEIDGPSEEVGTWSSAGGCTTSNRHFWSARSNPCQMQAQVRPNGQITMTDFIEGPTATLPGTANASSLYRTGYEAVKGHDGVDYSMFHGASPGEPNPWWQLDLGAPREVGSFTVHNRPDACAARWFENTTTSCRWEHPPANADAGTATYAGFKVGVSNTSCSATGEGCGGVVCGHVVRPNPAGEGHEYHVVCDPPVVGTHAYMVLPGERRMLNLREIGIRRPDAPHRGRFTGVEFKPNDPVTFGVRWQNGSFPQVGQGNCSGVCAVYGTTCLCNVTAFTETVFNGSTLDDGSVPSAAEIEAELRIGAVDPSRFDSGTFVRCTSAPCASQSNVTVYLPSGGSTSPRLTADTIFAIPDRTAEGRHVFFKNARSVVRLDAGSFAFRNPPSFSARNQQADNRDGEHDIDAILSHYFNHPTTPPFVAKALIQRLVSSNPSPRYVETVAVAFKTGRYLGFGNGTRGDLAATTAAIYLDREAQSHVLDTDPVHGGFREPLIKLIHALRALEVELSPGSPLLSLSVGRIVEFPFEAPTVFNFFQHDYAPAGAVEQASLVAPEASMYTAPNIMAYLNGMFATVEMGISSCYGGFGVGSHLLNDNVTGCSSAGSLISPATFGRLAYTPGGHGWTLLNVPESSRSYSSTYNDDAAGSGYARSMLGSAAAWKPRRDVRDEWMEMDLGEAMEVAAVVTQGRIPPSFSAVLRFRVNYSTDGIHYESLPDPFWLGGPGNDWNANTSHVGDDLVEFSGGNDATATDLQACTGECDADTDCAPGLRCYQRTNSVASEIPGCFGETPSNDWDYCFDPTGWEHAGQGESRFPQPVTARYIRLEPLEWHNDISLRAAAVIAGAEAPVIANFDHFTADADSAADVVDELNVILTGGRLGSHSRSVIEAAFNETLLATGIPSEALRRAEKLALISPEFQLTGSAPEPPEPVPLAPRPQRAPSGEQLPYKALVYFYFAGGADSFNMLVPYDGCDQDRYAEYASVRAEIALSRSSLLPVSTSGAVAGRTDNNTQPCARYGLHPNTPALHRLYNAGDALWVANMGTLVEPLTREEYTAKIKPRPAQIFAHNTQTHFTQNLDASTKSRVNGAIGRMMDVHAAAGAATASYSISGVDATVLMPADSDYFDILSSSSGAPKLDSRHESLVADVDAMMGQKSRSPYGNTWSASVVSTLNRSALLNDALDSVELEGPAEFRLTTSTIARQLAQVARLIKANQQSFHNEREAYYVQLGGFDVHANAVDKMMELMTAADTALADFENEMKLQGLWQNVTIMQASEFGRTVTSNGDGSDHAWGGNYWMAGGSVKGGQILGDYPLLGEESEVNLGRGRLLPTTGWEQVWNGVGHWFGVPDANMDAVLPGRRHFRGSLFSHDDLFVAPGTAPQPPSQPTPTASPSSSAPTAVWTAETLAAIAGSANTCYIALFTGACGSDGGVYKITPAWYAGHAGGPVIQQRCGAVVERWSDISSHAAFAPFLTARQDIVRGGTTVAVWVAGLSC